MCQAIIERSSDGLRFEPCYHPGLVRCEACLMLCEPALIEQHRCVDWWNVDMSDSRIYQGLSDIPSPAVAESLRTLWAQYHERER